MPRKLSIEPEWSRETLSLPREMVRRVKRRVEEEHKAGLKTTVSGYYRRGLLAFEALEAAGVIGTVRPLDLRRVIEVLERFRETDNHEIAQPVAVSA